MGLWLLESGLDLHQSTEDNRSKKVVLSQLGHLVRSATVRVAGVDASVQDNFPQLACVVPTCLVGPGVN